MMKIAFDDHIPASVLHDAQRMIAGFRAKKQAVRVVRLHVDDYMMLLEKVGALVGAPYTPTICDVPVEPWERAEFGVFAVADDDTPLIAAGGVVREERI